MARGVKDNVLKELGELEPPKLRLHQKEEMNQNRIVMTNGKWDGRLLCLESALIYSSSLAGIISLKDMMKFFELKVELED